MLLCEWQRRKRIIFEGKASLPTIEGREEYLHQGCETKAAVDEWCWAGLQA